MNGTDTVIPSVEYSVSLVPPQALDSGVENNTVM